MGSSCEEKSKFAKRFLTCMLYVSAVCCGCVYLCCICVFAVLKVPIRGNNIFSLTAVSVSQLLQFT